MDGWDFEIEYIISDQNTWVPTAGTSSDIASKPLPSKKPKKRCKAEGDDLMEEKMEQCPELKGY